MYEILSLVAILGGLWQVAAPIPFYLQAIGSISDYQPRIY